MNDFQWHQLRIAKRTLLMSAWSVMQLGGMTKAQARDTLRKLGWSEKRIRKHENQLPLSL